MKKKINLLFVFFICTMAKAEIINNFFIDNIFITDTVNHVISNINNMYSFTNNNEIIFYYVKIGINNFSKKKYHLKKMSEEKSTADSPSSTKEN